MALALSMSKKQTEVVDIWNQLMQTFSKEFVYVGKVYASEILADFEEYGLIYKQDEIVRLNPNDARIDFLKFLIEPYINKVSLNIKTPSESSDLLKNLVKEQLYQSKIVNSNYI